MIEMNTQSKRKIARNILLYLGLVFIASLLWKSWEEVYQIVAQMNYVIFCLSVFAGIPGIVVTAFLFNSFLAKYDISIPDVKAIQIFVVSQIAKYIPGKIWGLIYQASHIQGFPATAGVIMANTELMFAVMFMTSIAAIIVLAAQFSLALSILILIIGGVAFVLLCRTSAFIWLARFALRVLNKQGDYGQSNQQANIESLRGLLIYVLFTAIYIGSYLLMLQAVFDIGMFDSLILIALLSIAWIGGVLSLVFPAGVGIREFLFIFFSVQVELDYSFELLVSIALVTRFWQVLQEVSALALVFLLTGRRSDTDT